MSSQLVASLIILMVMFSFFWILLYSFQPSFVCDVEKKINLRKCVFAALAITLFIFIGIWLLGICY